MPCKPPSPSPRWIAGLLCILFLPAVEAKPNLIYILLDDAGFGDLSCYGQEKFSTPNVDRLATGGMKFVQHYSGSTVCAPTRCSLMTGKHTGRAVVRGNREIQPEGQAPMPAGIVTLPRLLRDAGYVTGAFGKWGLGAPGSESDPMEHFDRFYGYNCQRQAHTFYPGHLWSDRERVELDGETYSHDLIMEQALEFVASPHDTPFFAYLAIAIPHAAMQVPEEDAAPWREVFPEFESKIGKYAKTEVTNPIAGFAGMMTRMDRDIGRLLDLLEERGLDENTLVVFSSDNGPHQEGGHDPEFFDSNGPLRGFKRDLYEGGIRVPMLARWPGTIQPGRISGHLSAHWDILPTFCEIAGASIPGDTDGISFVAELTGRGDQVRHRSLYWEFHERGGRRAVRFGEWKAVQLNVLENPDGPVELYDLSSDLGEEVDLSASYPELVEEARQRFAEAHQASPDWPFAGD